MKNYATISSLKSAELGALIIYLETDFKFQEDSVDYIVVPDPGTDSANLTVTYDATADLDAAGIVYGRAVAFVAGFRRGADS